MNKHKKVDFKLFAQSFAVQHVCCCFFAMRLLKGTRRMREEKQRQIQNNQKLDMHAAIMQTMYRLVN